MKNISELILLGITISLAAEAGIAGALEARALVAQMVAEGRDPSDAEWDSLNRIGAALRSRIQAAADKATDVSKVAAAAS